MHPDWLSNSFVVADREGGTALFVDSGADVGPLVAAVERWGATPAAILRTHSHTDHVTHEHELRARYDIEVVAEPGEWEWGGLQATLVVWSPDYDGKGKAWVRFAGGEDAIVGGSKVERGV